jgi:hypothetical protein
MPKLTSEQVTINLDGAFLDLAKKLPDLLRRISERDGNLEACMMSVMTHAQLSALLSWFRDGDLKGLKYWSSIAGRIDRVLWQMSPGRFRLSHLMYPLIADDMKVAEWAGLQDRLGWPKDAQDPRQWAYRDYQGLLALRGDWLQLASRAERFLANIPASAKKFAVDEHFFLSLAHSDIRGMELALIELTSSRTARYRNEDVAYPACKTYVSMDAVIYAKIAWRAGFQVKVNTPYIPAEWLPIAPLPQ